MRFNVIVLDDEKQSRDTVSAEVESQLGIAASNIQCCQDINECEQAVGMHPTIGEWILVLDCDLSKTEVLQWRQSYGGFEAWSRLMACFPSQRLPFGALYSQKLVDLITAVCAGGAHVKRLLRPEIYNWLVPDDRQSLWVRCREWMKERQLDLVKRIRLEDRNKALVKLRSLMQSGNPQEVADVGEQCIWVNMPMGPEGWKLSSLFPLEWNGFLKKRDASWLQGICYRLQPQLPAVWHDFLRLLLDDLSADRDHAFKNVSILASAIRVDHLVSLMHGTKLLPRDLERAWGAIRSCCQILSVRQQDSIESLSPTLATEIKNDPIYKAINAAAISQTSDELASAFRIGAEIRRVKPFVPTPRNTTTELSSDERENFKSLPITPVISDLINKTLDAQAVSHGNMEAGSELFKGIAEQNRVRWFCFRTQNPEEGEALEADNVVMDLKPRLAEPKLHKLSSLIEIVCGQYGGTIFIIQGPQASRNYENRRAVYVRATTEGLTADYCESVPKFIDEELHGKVDEVGALIPRDETRQKRPLGTFYLVGFPIWKEGVYDPLS